MMKNSLYILLCLISLYACSDKEYMQRFADIRYTRGATPIQDIQTNGFYVETDKGSDNYVLIFYNDGTFVSTFLRYKLDSLMTAKPINLNKAVQRWGRKSRHWGQSYGLYKIAKDTIYVTQYDRFAWYYDITKYKYKIIDSENILLCFCEIPSLKQRDHHIYEKNVKLTYVPADSIPSPDNGFLKKKKWYWENESDWEEYMLKRKKKKNSK
ncbi:MAG: hypothetical protein K6G46_07345 [Prevotella sp.]|nr:hypothetical protein [Prevotella sp.]